MKYTSTQITNAVSKLECALGEYSYRECNARRLGLKDSFVDEIDKILGFLFGFQFWEQNSNGTTTGYTNYWSEEDLTKIMNYIAKL